MVSLSELNLTVGGLVVAFLVGCGGGASEIPTPTLPPPPTATPVPRLEGYTFPIQGGCLPDSDLLIPGAPRTYRNGFHEGLDLYDSDNCVSIGRNTPVVAARAGTVVRADVQYTELSASELTQLNAHPNTEQHSIDSGAGRSG